jgi:hypothetical protein
VQELAYWFLCTHLLNTQTPPFFKSLMFFGDEDLGSSPTSNYDGELECFSLLENGEPNVSHF